MPKIRTRIAPVLMAIGLPILLAGCPPQTRSPTGGDTGVSVPAGAPTTLPNRVVGRSSDPGPTPCATAIGLVNQRLATPAMVLEGSPDRTYRARINSGSGTYSYALAPVNPFTCQIGPVNTPTQTVTFAFTYHRDVTSNDPLCVETSILTINQFDPPLTNALIADPFKRSLWTTLEANQLIAPGGRCSNWIIMPPPFWP